MLTTHFAGTALTPSVLGLGTGGFGSDVTQDESFRMLDLFAESGGTLVDTANVYASWIPGGEGASERTVGAWFASRNPDRMLLCTKGGHPDLATMDVGRLTPEALQADVAQSLERLGRDNVDLYLLHRDDPGVPVDEVLSALQPLAACGALRNLGVSNWSTQRLQEANEVAAQRGWTGFCVNQLSWSLADGAPDQQGVNGNLYLDAEAGKWYREREFAVMAYSSQANGFFAAQFPVEGTATPKQAALAAKYLTSPEQSATNLARHAFARELAGQLGRSANEVALSYLWSQPFPVVALIGPRTVDQLRDSLRAGNLSLTREQTELLTA